MKKLFAIVAMLGLFSTTQVWAAQDEKAADTTTAKQKELVDKVEKLNVDLKAMTDATSKMNEAVSNKMAELAKLQADTAAAIKKSAELEKNCATLTAESAAAKEASYKLKIERFVQLLSVAPKAADVKATEKNIATKEAEYAKKSAELEKSKKELEAEKAKIETAKAQIADASFKKDSLGRIAEYMGIQVDSLNLEVACAQLNAILGGNPADAQTYQATLDSLSAKLNGKGAEIETVKNALAALINAKYPPVEEVEEDTKEEATEVSESGIDAVHKNLKTKFIEGGPEFMALVSIALVIGLAFCIERIIYLSLAKVNAKKLMGAIAEALSKGDVEAAKEVCRNTAGPVASICYQGLLRIDEGLDTVERSVVSYGSLQSSLLEKGCSWITLFIAMAPSLGFLGTVIGMVMSFDEIQQKGDISPTIVAGGMKVALITTIYGIIVALVLQVFYNFILTKIESIVADMEDSSITLLDLLTKYNLKK